ncbi:MAG: hypothetical protein J6W84_01150 [Bacteroidales bacterium]|nr:hypothetical protein [Bacteroidales bacterium]
MMKSGTVGNSYFDIRQCIDFSMQFAICPKWQFPEMGGELTENSNYCRKRPLVTNERVIRHLTVHDFVRYSYQWACIAGGGYFAG